MLIDGFIVSHYPPSPMEVAEAIRCGAQIYGAGSLGALRAVELAPLGMRGYGWVYEAFRSGLVDRDDEVVVLMHPTTFVQLTIPLINVRYELSRLVAKSTVSPGAAKLALRRLSGTHFSNRDEVSVSEILAKSGVTNNAIRSVLRDAGGIKHEDAIGCVNLAVAELQCRGRRA